MNPEIAVALAVRKQVTVIRYIFQVFKKRNKSSSFLVPLFP